MTRPVDLLLHYMPAVARETSDPWVLKFAEDMMAKAHWKNWNPSPKQVAMMNKLVSELFSHTDMEVIEE